MSIYKVITAVEHGDAKGKIKRYEPGSEIDLDDDQAVPLLEVGAIEALPEPVAPAKKK